MGKINWEYLFKYDRTAELDEDFMEYIDSIFTTKTIELAAKLASDGLRPGKSVCNRCNRYNLFTKSLNSEDGCMTQDQLDELIKTLAMNVNPENFLPLILAKLHEEKEVLQFLFKLLFTEGYQFTAPKKDPDWFLQKILRPLVKYLKDYEFDWENKVEKLI